MPDPLATLSVVFVGDTSPLDAAMRAAERRLRSFASRGALAGMGGRAFGRAASGLVSPVTDVFQKAEAVWRNSLSIGGLAAGGGVAFAAKKAMDLETAFVSINKAANLPAGEFVKLQEGIKTLATDSSIAGVSLDDLLVIARQGAKLGIQEKEGVGGLLAYTKALAMISVSIDDLPISEVATSLGQVSAIFGLSTDQALGYASAVDALDDASSASAAGIFDVAQRIAGSANSIGLGVDQVLGLSTALLHVGFNAESAGTTLNRIFGEIKSNPADFAAGLGLDPEQFKTLSSMQQVEAILQHLSTLPVGGAGFEFLKEVGIDGAFAKQALLQLSQTQGLLAGFTRVSGTELKTHGHIMTSVGMESKKAESALQLLWNRLDVLAAEFGQHLLPVIKGFGEGLGTMSEALKKVFADNAGPLEAWGRSLGEALANLGQLLTTKEGWGEFGNALVESLKIALGNLISLATWGGQRIGEELIKGAEKSMAGAGWLLQALNPAGVIGGGAVGAKGAAQMLGGKGFGVGGGAGEMPELRDPTEPFRKLLDRQKAKKPAVEEPAARNTMPMGLGIEGVMGFRAFGGLMGPPEPTLEDRLKNKRLPEITIGREKKKGEKAMTPEEVAQGLANMAGMAGLTGVGGTGLGAAAAAMTAPLAQKVAEDFQSRESMTGQTFGLQEYAKALQTGAFKKDQDHAKKTAEHTKETAKAVQTLPEKIAAALGTGLVARAAGPA